jgi:hypothetical protein
VRQNASFVIDPPRLGSAAAHRAFIERNGQGDLPGNLATSPRARIRAAAPQALEIVDSGHRKIHLRALQFCRATFDSRPFDKLRGGSSG